MRIREAIDQVVSRLGNAYDQKDMISWLDRLDRRVKTLIIDTHEGADAVVFSGYDERTDQDTALLVAAPFDEMYLRYLEAQIYYADNEIERYNNAIDIFNTVWEEFRNWYNREHMPLGCSWKF